MLSSQGQFDGNARPKNISYSPQKKRLALISVWGLLKKDEKAWKAALESVGGVSFGYEVDESIPVQYEKNWKDGNPSPGFVIDGIPY